MERATDYPVRFPTLEAFRERIEASETAFDVGLGIEGCPCFRVVAGNTLFDGHCWRTCFDCEYSGLHVTGTDPRDEMEAVGRLLKTKLDAMDWYGEWELHWTPRD